MEADQAPRALYAVRWKLREIERAAVIGLLDLIRDPFKLGRRMIEFPSDLDRQLRMSKHGVIIDRHAAIRSHHVPIAGNGKRIDFKRPRVIPPGDIHDGLDCAHYIVMQASIDRRCAEHCPQRLRIDSPACIDGKPLHRLGPPFDTRSAVQIQQYNRGLGGVVDRHGDKQLVVDIEHPLDQDFADGEVAELHLQNL